MATPAEGGRSLSEEKHDEVAQPAREVGIDGAQARQSLAITFAVAACHREPGNQAMGVRVLAQLGSAETLPTLTGWRQCGQVVADSRDQRWATACSRRIIS